MSTQIIRNYTFQQLESTALLDRTPAEVMAHATADADAIREQARADGHAAGYADGLERARTEAAPLLTALAEAVHAVTGTREELAEILTAQAGELALLTAEQMIAGAIAAQPERIVDVVRGALRRIIDRHRVTVLVNPTELELLSQSVPTLQAELGGIEHLDVQADRRVARGGAIAQTVQGEIDVSIAAQLQTARELVAAALAGDTTIVPHADDEPGGLVIADGI
jgi:flagellar assembly protein FliH